MNQADGTEEPPIKKIIMKTEQSTGPQLQLYGKTRNDNPHKSYERKPNFMAQNKSPA